MCCCGKPEISFQSKQLSTEDFFFVRKKFASGMTAEISFSVFIWHNQLTITPAFVIYRKRKQAWAIPNEITGQDGVAPLLWGKHMLTIFEEYVCWRYRRYPSAQFWVTWSNDKRGRLYKRSLARHGYSLTYEDSEFGLKKTVEKPETFSYCFS